MSSAEPTRGQTTLPAVAAALVLLTLVTALGLGLADSAIAGAERTPDERRVAAATAERLVAADGPLAARANVLNGSRVDAFDGATLRSETPATASYAVDVGLGGETLASTGDAAAGTTIRRLVLVERTDTRRIDPESRRLTLPRRATSASVTFTPGGGAAVRTMRVNEQIRLHNDSGLRGTFAVDLTPYRTTRIQFQTPGQVASGDVTITYETPRTTKTTLSVTVDA
ncbi:DUF7263 family protein [Haloarcula onubensis]|uniref:Flagellin n=1 Tax=Haloarcula onubensis TaxID=2950539 RepID=A0ABU2FJM9_9EURY|nr:hypothetical protein [Halomicroarcula sp. S3CR25-11]MDS0280964.1 hypothetical protein [Halomicroarcula sp. S3CR25-11]